MTGSTLRPPPLRQVVGTCLSSSCPVENEGGGVEIGGFNTGLHMETLLGTYLLGSLLCYGGGNFPVMDERQGARRVSALVFFRREMWLM